MTRKEMEDQVVQWLGLQDITDFNERQLVQQQLYLGTVDLLSRTRCVVRCLHLRLLADTAQYTLDHKVLTLVDVDNGATRRRRRDETASGFTLVGADVLIVKPTPSEPGELAVWAVLRPTQMAVDDDSPSFEQFGAIPEEYQDAIVTYAMWKCADYTDDSGSSQGERYRIQYEGQDGRGGRISEIKKLVNKRGTARFPRARVSLRPVAPSGSWTG